MNAIVADVADGSVDVRHPVMWIDADTTFLSDETFCAVAESAEKERSSCIHLNVETSIHCLDGHGPDAKINEFRAKDADVYDAILLVDEMARRASDAAAIKAGLLVASRIAHVEDSGLAFTIDRYLMSGGVDYDFSGVSNDILSADRRNGHLEVYQNILRRLLGDVATGSSLTDVVWLDDFTIQHSARGKKLPLKKFGMRVLEDPAPIPLQGMAVDMVPTEDPFRFRGFIAIAGLLMQRRYNGPQPDKDSLRVVRALLKNPQIIRALKSQKSNKK